MKTEQLNIIERQVIDFRQMAGLGETEAIHLKSLLLRLNVLTIFRPLSENFSGMSLQDSCGHRFMLVNSNQPRCRQHFTIAHELYHLFVEENPQPHRCLSDGKKSPAEQCADCFATLFLMPASGVLQLVPKHELAKDAISLATVLRIEHYFSVSRQAILYRLYNLRLISLELRDKLLEVPVSRSARDYGYDTALYRSGNENLVIGDFGEKARTLFEQGKISEGHYIEYMNQLDFDGGKN